MTPTAPEGPSLCFVADRLQWRIVLEAGALAQDVSVVTAGADVYYDCLLRGQPVISLWDFLPPADMGRHLDLAWELCEQIGQAFTGRVRVGGCDVGPAIQYDAYILLLSALNLSCAMSRALAASSPREVRHFAEMERPLLWDPTHPPADVFNLVAARAAAKRGIPRRPMVMPPEVLKQSHLARWPRVKPVSAPPVWPARRLRTLIFSGSIFHVEQEMLMDTLARREGAAFLAMSTDPETGGGPHVQMTLVRYLPFKTPAAPAEPGVSEVLNALALSSGEPDGVEILRDPAFHALFRRGWGEWLEAGVWEHHLASLCRAAYRPDRVVLPYDMEGPLRCMTRAWQDAGTPTLSVDHVGLATPPSARRNQGIAAPVAVWGEPDAAMHRRWRAPSARIVQTGSMRRDLARARELGPRRAAPQEKPAGRPTMLLITTHHMSDLMMHTGITRPAEFLAWWRALTGLTMRRTDWDWVLKTNPRYDRETFYRFVLDRHPHRIRRAGGDLVAALESASIMVLMVTPSTSAAHAILAGVPVVYFKPETIPAFRASPLEDGGAVTVKDFSALEREIERLLGDEKYREQVLRAQRAFLDRALVAVGGEAVERFVAALDELGSAAGDEPPDPAARWLMDMIMTVGYGMRGLLTWPEFSKRLDALGRAGRKMKFEHLDYLDSRLLADYFMNITLVAIWWRTEPERRIGKDRPWLGRILWRVYRALPDAIRPSPMWMVPYGRRTLSEEPLFNPDSRFWRWMGRRPRQAETVRPEIP